MSGKFGTSMFGFKRKNVIDFIEQIGIEQKKEEEQLFEELLSVKNELSASKAQNEQLSNCVSDCERQLEELRAIAAKLRSEIDNNGQAAKKIGNVFIDAKMTAAQIIENANEDARNIVDTANECANSTISDISESKNQLDDIRKQLQQMLVSFDDKIVSVSNSLEKAKSHIKPTGTVYNKTITEDDLIDGSVIGDNTK